MKLVVKTLDNLDSGDIDLNDSVFGLKLRIDLLHKAVNWQLAKRRAGTHKTKGISEISGTTKKPYKQKGTGRARQGSLRSPQFRGGAQIFGPVVRSHEFNLPKKIRRLALKHALSSKAGEGKLIILEVAQAESHYTRAMKLMLQTLGLQSALIIDGGPKLDRNFQLAVRNLPSIDLLPQQGANVYDILRREILVLTRTAVKALEARLK